MKKLISFLPMVAIVIIGCIFTSCKKEMKQDIQQANQVTAKAEVVQTVSIKMEEDLVSPEARESQAVSCLPKALIPQIQSLNAYGVPATQFGVPKGVFDFTYINANTNAGEIKLQIRTKNGTGRLVVRGPYALDPTGNILGEFSTAEPFNPDDFPLKLERVVTSISGCSKSNFYYPATPVIIPLPQ